MGFFFGLSAVMMNYSELKTQRDPATYGDKIFQITSLTSKELKAHLKVNETINGEKTIEFRGFASSLCKLYPTIEMKLAAEGILINGIPPKLKISFPCEPGQDPAEIAPVKIAVSQLKLQTPKSDVKFIFDGNKSTYSLENSDSEWPLVWTLEHVEFIGDAGSNKKVNFDRSPASVQESLPVVIEF